ncbi:hypothetical protein T484DRAFT_1630125 [Baffinella frigidus]|nr:hypothetical protein T484DRAFT_1630125 [Cryptophyta sp. CCMP2293]
MPKVDDAGTNPSNFGVQNPTANGAESARMNGRWKMLWTDEQEVLFLVEKGLFWDPCLAVYQDFDVAEEKFGNIIEFDNESKFTVQSSFEPLGNRFDFKFQTAQIKWRQFQVPIPPVGAGWSEQIYLDDTFRMAKDSRGVLLIVQKQ